MKSYKDFVTEAKQAGILYHITPGENVARILRDDALGAWYHAQKEISLTRNPRYNIVPGKWEQSDIKFYLDGDKISNRYKIYPKAEKGYGKYEAETRIEKALKPLGPYLLAIEIMTDKINDETFFAIRQYLKKYPHILLRGKIPHVLTIKDKLKRIEGYWYNGKVYDIHQLVEIHPKYKDYEDIDIGYVRSRENHEDEVSPGIILVDVIKENPVKIEIIHDKKEPSSQVNKIFHRIKLEIPEAEVSAREATEYNQDDYEE